MIAPLKAALAAGDDVLVISHSLGTMMAYDTFWKFCCTGEYRPDFSDKKISLWLTLGSPLADETVKRHLNGASIDGERRHPNNVVDWVNVAAQDDFICHDESMANDYSDMKRFGSVRSITDLAIVNLAVRNGIS